MYCAGDEARELASKLLIHGVTVMGIVLQCLNRRKTGTIGSAGHSPYSVASGLYVSFAVEQEQYKYGNTRGSRTVDLVCYSSISYKA